MAWEVAAVVAKALLYAACLTAAGGALFVAIFNRQLDTGERRFVVKFVRAAAVTGIVITLVRIPILSGMLGDDIASLWDWSLMRIVLEGSEGEATVVRVLALFAIAVFSPGTSSSGTMALFGAVASAASFALTGHSGSLGASGRLLVTLHIFAASYWVGALVPLYRIAASPDAVRVGGVLRRFGTIAVFGVVSLILVGATLLWLLLGSLDALLFSDYGRLVLIKLFLVAGLLALAAVNKLRLTPAVAAGDRAAVMTLRRSIAGEMALVAAILIATATFTTIVGPPELE